VSDDIYGDVIDADTVEIALVATLKDFLPGALAHQERRRPDLLTDLPPTNAGHFLAPKTWPMLSEFDSTVETQLPAVTVVSPGAAGTPTRDQHGAYRFSWRFQVSIEIAGRDERQARKLASVYLAAIRAALAQNRTLGGEVEQCRWIGGDDHAVRTRHPQRAVYSTNFEVTVRNVVNDRLGPETPPEDPYNPGPFPPLPEEAEFIVETTLEDTP
jgi:hypothetical protein